MDICLIDIKGSLCWKESFIMYGGGCRESIIHESGGLPTMIESGITGGMRRF